MTQAAAVRPETASARAGLRAWRLVPLLAAALPLVAACASTGGGTAQPTVTVTAPVGSSPGGSLSNSSPATAGPPGIVAVTTTGALVRIDPTTGSIGQTLVPAGVFGDEISVSPDQSTVYYTQRSGCDLTIMSVSTGGGNPTAIAPGELPAISPDGTKLAYAREPLLTQGCIPNQGNLAADFKLVIRTVGTGAEKVLPQPPQVVHGGLFQAISHLSWAADSVHLAVSIAAVQDNEGWGLNIVDTSAAPYYTIPGAGVTTIPVTGSPDAQRSYIREGVFVPDGNLFVSRACCGGVPIHNTSRLMWVVGQSGALVHQVAIGYPSLEHLSLAADSTGQWLLYLAGADLYVSQNENRPSKLASGLMAAAWM